MGCYLCFPSFWWGCSVCVCECLCIRTHAHTLHMRYVSPGVGTTHWKSPKNPDELNLRIHISNWLTLLLLLCKKKSTSFGGISMYMCTKYTCIYICWAARWDLRLIAFFSFNKFLFPKKSSKRCERQWGKQTYYRLAQVWLLCLIEHVRAACDSTLWRYRRQKASGFWCTKIPLCLFYEREGLCAQILYLRFEIIGGLRSHLLLFFFDRKSMFKKKTFSPRSHPAS